MDIKNFLQSSYKKENFIEFIYDKFYGFEENNTDYVTALDTEQKDIQKYKFFGSCELDDGKEIGFFEFISNDKKDIENNRVSFNKFLEKRVNDELLDGAIAVFTNPSKPNVWRLSFIRFSYDENDKQQVTNLKRFTFVLGVDIPTKTAIQQLEDLKYPRLDELELAFSVEKISKEFFKKYKELYYKLVKDITVANGKDNKTQEEQDKHNQSYEFMDNEKDISFYIKKLLGRIVFLYFVQKKGWLNDDKKFLSNLFTKHTDTYPNGNFYDEVLEELFFNGLNKNQGDDKTLLGDDKYTIPYLNGGLFEADKYDDTDLTISNENLKEVLELFDSYNFTVIEDTPHDSEIAIDPEMLGRVFEDLLEDRKDKGAYYTPREIVHYMCQQSIINYLSNDFENLNAIQELVLKQSTDNKYIRANAKEIQNKLFNIKVLDPAIGSGAFPMGMLHEIVQILSNIDKTAHIGELKRKVIEHCIYGVDIEHSAVEIAKLRFWLSIVVDEEEPTPLPNLFYKIMVGNSLLENIYDINPLKQHGNTNEIKFLNKKFHKFFNTTDNKEKQQIKQEIKENILTVLSKESKKIDIQPKLEMDKKEQKKYDDNLEKYSLIQEIIKEYKDKGFTTKLFLYNVYFKEVMDSDGFDVVIGNPPYIKEYTNKSAFDRTYDLECYQGKMDIWYLFGCKAIDLLKDNGILSFIATNNWISNFGASKFRNKVLTTTKIKEFIDFGDYKVFDTAGIQTMILTTKKFKNVDKYECKYSKIINSTNKKELLSFLEKKENYKFSIFNSSVEPKKLLNQNITFLESSISFILDKIESNKNFTLDKTKEVAQGIVTPNDNVTKKSLQMLGDNYQLNEGIFNLTTEEKNNLNFTNEELNLIKPLYTTSEIERYKSNDTNEYWIIYTDSSFKNKDKIKPYPNLKNHLDKFKQVITSDNKPYGIHRARNEYFFKDTKILSLRKCVGRPVFTYVDFDSYVNQAFYVIKSERINLKYLTALLNSKLVAFWLKYKGKMQGDNFQVDKEPILNIPIKNIEDTKSFEILVDYIMYLKTLNTNIDKYADNGNIIKYHFEEVLDALVYELYFTKEFQDKDIEFLKYAKEYFKPIENLSDEEKINTIHNSYLSLTEQHNEIRNNLELMTIRLKDLILPIKRNVQ
ncbi:MAG: Eco57I restriction-modification methylase domain-containing protein [Campylobacterota bacterium]|nr:Eco57I restriction-modification methylase domain-containing protein [Campylobacterota bacterium]